MATIENTHQVRLESTPTIDLAKYLEWQYGEGEPLDGEIALELARRALQAEQTSPPATDF